MHDSISNFDVVKFFGAEEAELRRYKSALERFVTKTEL